MHKAALTLFLYFFPIQLFAQRGQIVFDHYGLEAGFNSREAMDVVTTPNGMAWISSNDGLVRFDSKRFKFYKHIDGDTNSLTNNYCKGLAIDKRGLIWIQSDDDLDVFNTATERFSHIRIPDGNNGSRPVYPITFTYDSIADIMWVGTAKGLYYSKAGALSLQDASQITRDTLVAASAISNVVKEGTDILWITTWDRILKLNTRNGYVDRYQLPVKVDGIHNPPAISNFPSAYLDVNKILWLGTWINGLVSFNTLTKTFHQYIYRDNTKEENTIIDIAQTPEQGKGNMLWLSTAGYGLAGFDMITKKFTSYNSTLPNDPSGINGTTYGLYTADKNCMWIGSATGLHRYDYNKQLFKTIDISSIAKDIQLAPVSNMAIQKNKSARDEILWFYIPYHGGYLYDLVQQKTRLLPPKVASFINMPAAFLHFYIDSKNILWISAIGSGLTGYDIDKDAIIFTSPKPFGEANKWIVSFFEDRDNKLWVGSRKGLYVMDTSRKTVTSVITVNDGLAKKGLANVIEDITQDEDGNIWFTADGTDKKIACIGKFNPGTNQLEWVYNEREVAVSNHNPAGLRSIVYNGNGKILVAFHGEGITWFQTTDKHYTPHVLNTGDGLNSNRTNGLIADKAGNTWCSTSFGFSCYKKVQNSFTNYSNTSYPLDNTPDPAMYLSHQSGIMYVGQVNAIRYFNTAISEGAYKKNQLVFTEMKVLNKPISFMGKQLMDGDMIRLSYQENMVSIEFALLNYTNAADNTYSWMLKGWDKEWITSKNNVAAYINLEPGTYTLLVKAANSQGQWTDKPIQLTIAIAYPFYQTWWFVLLCALAIASVVYWLVQLRIRRIKEKFQLRNKIAADLHDEIGSTLTSINILSNVSQQAMEQQPQQAREMLQKISSQSKTIQQNMSDIVWSIRPDNEKVADLATRMREYAAQTLEPLEITTTIEANEELAARILPMDHRKELLLIYKEAINNIVKHAGATVVVVSLHQKDHQIFLTISDNGNWKGDSSGTGTLSMKARAASLGGSFTIVPDELGTKVTATIPIP
ncbi:MAG: triple tyrosine motif-containing protein [Bacteroidota bacterium]